ncbi:MAG: hypothetical protein V4796_13730 [Burkholderia cenocepacia]
MQINDKYLDGLPALLEASVCDVRRGPAFITVGGAVLTAIAIELRFDADEKPVTDMLNMFGYSQNGFAERAASSLLQTLGVPRTEATEIANRPLPPAVTSALKESPER